MKKLSKVVSIIAFIPLLVASFAGSVLGKEIPVEPPDYVPEKPLSELITQISSTILFLVGIVAVLFLIIGGFQYITASGNPEQVETAKKTIMYAIIGIIVCLLSYAVVYFVIGRIE
jgi:amino acid transporter